MSHSDHNWRTLHMATIGYVRVSTNDQSVEAQKHSLAETYAVNEWYEDA
ncbi:recombinase family protein, partial [Pseudomonas avellanae]